MFKKSVISVLVLLIFAAAGLFYGHNTVEQFAAAPRVKQEQLLKVPKGTHFTAFGRLLAEQGLMDDVELMPWFGRLHPELTRIKSGTFMLQSDWSLYDILNQVISGKEHQFAVTFVEGITFKEWRQQLAGLQGIIKSQQLDDEKALAHVINGKHEKLEGLLQPQTYYYTDNTSSLEIVKRAYQRQQRYLMESWQNRQKDLPLKSPYEALILASIIEKETGYGDERTTVSSVFINRLRKGMRLQTDPTVIYGMGDSFDGNIRRKDLRAKTAYNTYVINGLPPTPIAMPGPASIDAALHPAQTKFLYFVSKGNGQHYFSKSLKEHNRAVRKYILGK